MSIPPSSVLRRDRAGLLAASAALASLLAAGPAAAQFPGLDTRLVASGLNQPLYATAPLADGRLFVVEKRGTIRLFENGVGSEFLRLGVATSGEQGLLGLAFDPGYGDAAAVGYRRFFVDYIDPTTRETVIASYRANAAGTAADLATRREVMRVAQPEFSNHKAGWIGFKPGDADHLFIATGDGGSSNDPFNVAQDRSSLLGKMLRIDVNRDDFAADPNRNYAVPTDNPFFGTAGVRGEIFAYGLRNPFRNSFDRATGDLWIADVGQNEREEVNRIAAASGGGQNFGWRVREGDIATPGVGGPLQPGMVDPTLVYTHGEGSSITGGYVVRDAASPLAGRYVFGDFVNGRIWAVDANAPSFANAVDISAAIDAGMGGALGNIASFGEGAAGELYIVDFGGRVVQVVPEPAPWMLLAGGLVALAWRRRTAAPSR